ncbi:MAG: serine/threonine protein kinase [Gemmatimonadaceae bacterium]|nr:serine/threonine protein kinase [Gemmatimonadaceae bacterium]
MSRTKICPRCGETYDDAVAFCATDGTRLVRGGQPTDLIGTVIAERYRIVSRIGEGGMGQVYLGEHVRMKRKSAIKIMRPSLVGEVEALQRFTREAENASQLSHPNIAAIFDFGETADGVVYLAMEYVDGYSLAGKLQESAALHPDVAADILGQAADALQAAHDLNMLHRDIKPDNIMLGKRADGTYLVKLVDFGIARTMDGSDQKVTRTGFAVGTPQYMSPEQLAGDTLDARSDQYSLALVAFFSLTGKQAFPAESSKESLIARLTSRPQTLQNAKQDVQWPDTLQEVFDRALAPEPSDRYATVSDFAHALSGAISGMTPSQTAELYRRALDMRVANVAARTPHSDLESLRTPSGQLATMRTQSGAREAVSRTGATAVTSTSTDGTSANGGTGGTGTVKPRARWPFIIGGVVTVSVAATLYVTQRDRQSVNAADSTVLLAVAPADTTARVSVPPVAASAPPTVPVTPPAAKPMSVASDSSRRVALRDSVRRDSVRRDAAKRAQKAAADSAAKANSVRARYPEAAERAMIGRGIDAKARLVKSGDVRAVIMSTPMFVWRAEQARAWKNANTGPGGTVYSVVDPIEVWSAWTPLAASHRAVYVLEVTTEKAPWPAYAPEKLFDIKRGDVSAVEVLRDGAPVSLDATSRIPAVVNGPAHLAAGKAVTNAFVATLAPTSFIPREDGTWPRIELLVHDATRDGAITRVTLSESLVRRLYDDFAPWRDAISRP